MHPFFEKLFRRVSPIREVADIFSEAVRTANSNDFARAVHLYEQAIALDPYNAEAYYKQGNALRSLGKLEHALASYDLAIQNNPNHSHAYCNRGTVQQSLGLISAALASYDRAIGLNSTDARAHYNRALLMQDCENWAEALASYERAITIDGAFADAQYNRSLALLFQGKFIDGWRAFEWRWRNAARLSIGIPRAFTQPLWLGSESLTGKRVLLYCEGGLGDTVQFCRYATLSAALGAHVILEVQAPLARLLAQLDGVSELIVTGSAVPPFDYQCPLMSLPLAFKTTLETVPKTDHYLSSDAAKVLRWRKHLGERRRPRVGLAWSGNPNNSIDIRRSVKLSDWAPYLPQGVDYFCLQQQVRDTDRVALEAMKFISSIREDSLDFVDTAALCECMDIIVSVDTSLAHLSAALGRPTWILLPATPDWRWLEKRKDSPWYPTAKLYRQTVAGDWSDVFVRVADDLREQFGLNHQGAE